MRIYYILVQTNVSEVGQDMTIAINRLFRKKLPLLFLLLLVLTVSKIVQFQNAKQVYPRLEHLEQWSLTLSSVNSDSKIDAFYKETAQKLSSSTSLLESARDDLSALLNSINNRKSVQKLIRFAIDGQGALPVGLPVNYLDLQDFYSELSVPSIISEQPLNLYFSMHSSNLILLLMMVIYVSVWGTYYDIQIDRLVKTTLHGRSYSRGLFLLLTALGLILLLVNEAIDLYASGLLRNHWMLHIPAQSYSAFSHMQQNISLAEALTLTLPGKICSLLLLSALVRLIAKRKRGIRETLIWSALFLLVTRLLFSIVDSTSWSPLIQIGLVDWKQLLAQSRILLPLKIPTIYIGNIITSLLTIFAWIILMREEKK